MKDSSVSDEWFDYNSSPADVVRTALLVLLLICGLTVVFKILWSACKDDQTSADTFQDGVATGAMSWVSPRAAKSSLENTNWLCRPLCKPYVSAFNS